MIKDRDTTIKRLSLLLETSSDEQIEKIEEAIKLLMKDERWSEFDARPSTNFARSSVPFASEDVEEGNFGTLYRGNEID